MHPSDYFFVAAQTEVFVTYQLIWIIDKSYIQSYCCWVSKMVIPVYGVSEEEALCDRIY